MSETDPSAHGADCLTPQERLQELGYTFDETGSTLEDGRGVHAAVGGYEEDPWRWAGLSPTRGQWWRKPGRRPNLVLRCADAPTTVVGYAWSAPTGRVVLFREVGEGSGWLEELDGDPAGDPLLLHCSLHGTTQVTASWVVDFTRSRNQVAKVQCTSPRPVYDSP